MRTGFGGTLSHKRGLITGVSAIALAAAMSMAAPSGALAANCGGANNITGTNSGNNNGGPGAASLTCLQNNVVGDEAVRFNGNAGLTGGTANIQNNQVTGDQCCAKMEAAWPGRPLEVRAMPRF